MASSQVFISYGRTDARDFAKRLQKDLEDRGQRTWLDLSALEEGTLFEVRIEQGIRASSVVAAVMTPQSVREESVCRDEIVFALNEGKSVVPLRAHPHVRPTLLLCRRNWIDFTGDYDTALSTLLSFLQGDASTLTAPALGLVSGIAPMDFSLEIARHSTGFIGRGWLLREVDTWLTDARGACLVLVGEPGVGKSAAAAWLCLQRPDVVAIHFCTSRNSRSLDAHEFTASVVAQLHARLPGYGDLLQRQQPELRHERASDAFRELVVQPLRELQAPPRLVVIDSLDEASTRPGENIVDVLAEHAADLPPWLKIVATTRPEARVLDRIRAMRVLHLASGSPDNLEDLRTYCRSRIGDVVSSAVAERVEAIARGNFLYARMALEAIHAGVLSADDLGTLAPGIADFYAFTFRRRFRDTAAFARDYGPVLSVLVAARGPLSSRQLAVAAGLTLEDAYRRVRDLSGYLRPVRDAGETRWSIFHPSLGDWLTDPEAAGEHWCAEERGHELLGKALFELWPADEYALRHLPAHLLAGGVQERLLALLCRLDFVERKCAQGMTNDLVADYDAARLALAAQPGPLDLRDFERFVRRRAHVLALSPGRTRVEAALEPASSAPSRAARRGDGPASPWIDWVNRPVTHDAILMTIRAHEGAVAACLFAPNDDRLLTASADGTLRVWNARTGAVRAVLRGHTGSVLGAAWSPDGARIASVSADRSLRFWEPETGREVGGWTAHDREVTCCAYSPRGDVVVTGSRDGTLRVWEAASGARLATLSAHHHAITCCAFSRDGRRLFSGAEHHRIGVWDTSNWTSIKAISAQDRGVTCLAVSPDGRRFVSGSEDRTLVVWDTISLEPLAKLQGHRSPVWAAAWSSDARRIMSGGSDGMLRLWDADGGEMAAASHTDEVTAVSVSPDGGWIASAAKDGKIRLWDAAELPRAVSRSEHSAGINACAISPDGHRFVTASGDQTLAVWDARSGTLVARWKGHTQAVLDCTWSPDGSRVLSGSRDNTARLWDGETGRDQIVARLLSDGLGGTLVGVTSCTFSPDGRLALAGTGDGTLGVRDVINAKLLTRFIGHESGVRDCAFSPDGGRIASASWDGTVRVWDLLTGAEIHTLAGHRGSVRGCVFSPDGRRIASFAEDGTMRLWDSRTGSVLGVVLSLAAGLRDCAFLPDGRRIATAGEDGAVRVFDLKTRQEIAVFFGDAAVRGIAVGPGSMLVAGDTLGRPLLLRLVGFESFPAVVTATRLFHLNEGVWDGQLTVRCPLCGRRVAAPERATRTASEMGRTVAAAGSSMSVYGGLGEEAWDVPDLVTSCSECDGPLQLNPFVLDRRGIHP